MISKISKIVSNKVLVNGSLFAFFSFVNQGIGFLLLILLANYILPAEYGQLSLFNTIVTFLGYFVALSTQGYLSVSYFKKDSETFRNDVSAIMVLPVAMTMIFCILLLFTDNYISKLTSIPTLFLWVAIVISFFSVFQGLLLDLLRVQEKVIKYGIISCGIAIINFVLSLYLVINRGLSWEGRVYAHLICAVFFGVLGIGVFISKRLVTIKLTKETFKMVVLWGIPLIPHQAAIWLKSGCDRLIINQCHTLEDVGLFSFALNLMSIIIIIGQSFNSTNSVTIYQTLSSGSSNQEKRQKLGKLSRTIFLIYICATALVMIGASVLVPIVLPKYSYSIYYFLILSVSAFLQCIYFLYCNYLFYYGKNKNLMMITFLSAILHLGLSLIFTRYSLFITCVIYTLSQLIVLVFVKKETNKIIKTELC